MIISSFLLLICHCELLCLIFGCREHRIRTIICFPPPSPCLQCSPLKPSLWYTDQDDTGSTDGQCSSKAAYAHLAALHQHTLPPQGSRAITAEANLIQQKVWKGKIIPPFLKTFAWGLVRRALATGERAGRYSSHIDQHCSYCCAIKNDVHMFFFCDLSRQVWATSNPPLPTNSITDTEDGVQLAPPMLILLTPLRLFSLTPYSSCGIFGKRAITTFFKERL